MRIAFIDLETSGLDADGWNTVLCGCIVEYQPPTFADGKLTKPPWTNLRTFRREQYKDELWDDYYLARAIMKAIQEYDICVSWNGIKFDESFLETRLREYGIHGQRWKRHKDALYTARYKLRMSSNTLDNVADFHHVYRKYGVKKTKLDRHRWRMAIRGNKQAYQYVVSHCQEDVRVLACVWEEIKDLVNEIK